MTTQELTIADYKTSEGSWWCPGWRRLRRPRRAAEGAPRFGDPSGTDRPGGRNRLLWQNRQLHQFLQSARNPRANDAAALGLKLGNRELTVIAAGGDGDGYAIGMGHFIHAIRRNPDITYLVMDNQIYGTHQDSPHRRPQRVFTRARRLKARSSTQFGRCSLL